MVVIKQFDGGNVVYDGKFVAEDMTTFITAESLPLVMEFTDESASKIFGGEIKSHLLLFTDTKDEQFASLKAVLETTAQGYKGKVLFIYIDGEKGDNSRYAAEVACKQGLGGYLLLCQCVIADGPCCAVQHPGLLWH